MREVPTITHTEPAHANAEDRPSTDALALVAEIVGASPSRLGHRAVLMPDGLVAITVVDFFTERVVDLHWEAIAESLADPCCDVLSAFEDVRVDGYRLAWDTRQLPRTSRSREEGS